MPESAHVGSLDAIERFHNALVGYVADVRRALNEVSEEIRRTKEFVQVDRKRAWDAEMRKRQRTLEEAEAAVFSARLSAWNDVQSAQQMAANKARRAVREADEKIRIIQKWARNFDEIVAPMEKRLQRLNDAAYSDLPKAIAALREIQRDLEQYLEIKKPGIMPSELDPSDS